MRIIEFVQVVLYFNLKLIFFPFCLAYFNVLFNLFSLLYYKFILVDFKNLSIFLILFCFIKSIGRSNLVNYV